MKNVPQSIVAFIFAAMQEKSRSKEKTRQQQKMPQIRTMVVGNILVKCPASTHSATFSPP